MGHIRWMRVIVGGLVAGLVINAFEYLLNSLLLRDNWATAIRALGKAEEFGGGQVLLFVLWGFLVGIFAIWLYAELQPHYGGRPITAAIAGVAVWFLGYLLAAAGPIALNLFPLALIFAGLAVGLVESLAGTMVGAWIYQSGTIPRTSPAPAKS